MKQHVLVCGCFLRAGRFTEGKDSLKIPYVTQRADSGILD